jgi:hypothetical protein
MLKKLVNFYLCTVHVVTFTLLENQLIHLFQHFHIHIKTPERLLKMFHKTSYINKNPYVVRFYLLYFAFIYDAFIEHF